MKSIGFFILILCIATSTFGQQNVLWNQSLFNYYQINSAYAGSKNTSSLGLSYRTQWTGVEGAPKSQYITYHAPINIGKMGLGFKIERDDLGLQHSLMAELTLAYHIKLKRGIFSMALDGSIKQGVYSFSELDLFETDDVYQVGDKVTSINPGIGFSLLYQTNHFIGGLRAKNINTSPYDLFEGSQIRDHVQSDIIVGFAKRLSKTVVWKPFVLFKLLDTKQMSYSISSNFSLKNKFTLGVSYRNNSNLNLLLHFFVRNNLRMGYSYEMGMSDVINKQLNSHEIFMGLNTGKKTGELVSPRFYDL